MGRVITDIEHGTRIVGGVPVSIRELVWDDGGRSFEVHRVDTGDDLTEDGCFDIMPTDEQITQRPAQPGRTGGAAVAAAPVSTPAPAPTSSSTTSAAATWSTAPTAGSPREAG